MKIKALFITATAVVAYSLSTPAFSQSITATSCTLNEAETRIAEKARELNANYRITEANMRNRVHMTAELY